MRTQLSKRIKTSLDAALQNVGDISLKRRARYIVEGLDLKDGNKVLEAGCGNGYYLSLLNRLDVKLDLAGIDIDKSALKDAAKFIADKKVKLVLADASGIPFADNSFDRVVMSEVIEHVADERKSLKEVYRVLKKGGILTLTTCSIDYPFLWDPVNWILQHFFKTHIKKGFWAGIWNQHTRLYKEEQIAKLLKETGFKIDKIESLTGWCLPFNHYIVNFIARLFYSRKLPSGISKGMNKFENNSQPFLLKSGFRLMNLFDSLNDVFPQKSGVSIFAKVRKNG